MVQEVIPSKIEVSKAARAEITPRLVRFQDTTLLGLIVQSDTKHHYIVAPGDLVTSRTSLPIKSIGGTWIDENRRAYVIAADNTNGVLYFATPIKLGDQLLAHIDTEDPTLGDTVQVALPGGSLTSQIVDIHYQNWIPKCPGYYPINSLANPLRARLPLGWNFSFSGVFVFSPETGALLGIASGMDPETASTVITKAFSFEKSMLKVQRAFARFLTQNPGETIESIRADNALYAKLRAETHIRPTFIGMNSFHHPSSGGHIIHSLPIVVDQQGQLAEQVYYDATEIRFLSPANQNEVLVEDFMAYRYYGYGAIVQFEYKDALTEELVIAKSGDLNFGFAPDTAALRADGHIKLLVSWTDNRSKTKKLKEYTLELEKPVKETVVGQELTRKLGELTLLAQTNQISQFVYVQPGTKIEFLDGFKANDFGQLCALVGPGCGGRYNPYSGGAYRGGGIPAGGFGSAAVYGREVYGRGVYDGAKAIAANDFNFPCCNS
jgi:hypothetical protein